MTKKAKPTGYIDTEIWWSRAAVVNPAAVAGLARLRKTKGESPQAILAAHHEILKDDPQRLSAEFITALARMPRGGESRE